MNRNNLVAILVGLSCGSVSATTAIQTAQDGSMSSSFTNAANWAIDGQPSGAVGAPLDPAVDYVNPGGKNLCSPRWYDESSPSVFAGHSLTLGSSGGAAVLAMYPFADGAHITFANDGLKLVNGTFCNWYGHSIDIYGKIQVDNCLEEKPIQMYSNGSGTQLVFHGPVSSDEGKRLWLYARDVPEGSTWAQKHFVARFVEGSLAGFKGRVSCCQYAPTYADAQGPNDIMTELVSDTDTIPGTVELGYNCRIGAETAESVVSVGTLVFKDNSGLSVTFDKTAKKASLIKVTGSFSKTTPVRIVFNPMTYATGTYPEADIVPEIAVFKAPMGVKLDLAGFVLEAPAFPVFDLYERTDESDGLSTLYIKQHGKVVKMTASDVTSTEEGKTQLSWDTGDHWDVPEQPNLGNVYYQNGKEMRVYGGTSPRVFPGYALALNGSNLDFYKADNVISNLIVLGSVNIFNYGGGVEKLSGHVTMSSGTGSAMFYGNDGRTLIVDSDISGTGNVKIMLSGTTVSYVRFNGDNSAYAGAIIASSGGKASETGYICFSCPTAASLGGPMADWTYNGHELGHYLHFYPDRSMTLERKNCGLFVSSPAYICCTNEDITLSIKEKITWKGRLTKLGSGTLALGGAAPAFVTKDGTVPMANSNVLAVAEGRLKPLSAEAFTGLAVTLASGTGIAVDVPADTTDGVGKYGMLLTGAGSSLTVQGTEVPVSIDVPEGVVAKSQFVPICTVSTEAAGALRGKFVLAADVRAAFAGSVTIEERADAVADTVTFGAKLTRGMILILR